MIRAVPFTGGDEAAWDALVGRSANGCFLHTRRFYGYHGNRFDDCSLLLFRRNSLRGVVPAARQDGTVASHPGCTFGGIVFDAAADSAEVEEMLNAAEAAWQGLGAEAVTFTLPPWFAHPSPNQAAESALCLRGYDVRQDAIAFVPLHGIAGEPELLDLYRSSTRGQTRQALRHGLDWKWSDELRAFWDLLERNLADRHEAEPVHSFDEIMILRELFGDTIRLLGVYHEDVLVAGSIVFDYGAALHTQYIATDYSRSELRPTNLLYHGFLAAAAAEGYAYASFGISSEGFGGPVNAGLRRFKEGFGARPALFQRYTRALRAGGAE